MNFNFMPRTKKMLETSKESEFVAQQKEMGEVPSMLPEFPKEVLDARNIHMEMARRASAQRETRSEFFDMMTYTKDYEKNRQYANTFLRPKKNDSETRVNAGTLEKKIDVLVNELVSINLEGEIRCYDKNNIKYIELGHNLTNIVRITNMQERDVDFWPSAFRELVVQRIVYIQDTFADYYSNSIHIQRPEKVLMSGLKVFLGDINLPLYQFNKQPYIWRYHRMTWEAGNAIYGKNPRFKEMWKYVKPGMGNGSFMGGLFDFRLFNINRNEIEIKELVSTVDDEYMLYIQSVPMTPAGTKFSDEIWKFPSYDMAASSVKDVSIDWTYGRGIASAGKVLAALTDDQIRSMVRKAQQALEPPTGIKKQLDINDPTANKIYNRQVFDPGTFTQGLSKDDFSRLVDHQGVTQSDMNMLEKITGLLQEQVGVPDQLQGLKTSGTLTATESVELKRQGLKQIGLIVIAAMRLVRECTYLRLYNVLTNWTDVIGKAIDPKTQTAKDLYRFFVINDTDLEDGLRGTREIYLMDRAITDDEKEAIYQREKDLEEKGKIVRSYTIDFKTMLDIGMQFYCVALPKEQEGSTMDKALFSDALNQAKAISDMTGRPLNADKIVDHFQTVWDKKGWFKDPQATGPVSGVDPSMGGIGSLPAPGTPVQSGSAPLPSPTQGNAAGMSASLSSGSPMDAVAASQ